MVIGKLEHRVAAVLLAAAMLHGCDRRQQAAPQMPVPEVGVVTVAPQEVLLTTELPGRTSSYLVSEIRPQVSGIVQKRLFTEGSDVKANDVLYKLDPALFQAALDTALANVEVARKTVDRSKAALAVSMPGIPRQKATLDLALANRKRLEDLFKSHVASASDRDDAVTAAEVAQATLDIAGAQIESDKQAIAGAEAALKQAEVAVETARINLGYTKICAPISGRIGKSSVTDGALVTAFQPAALSTIQQLDPIYVDVPQSTSDVLRLRRRMENGRLNLDEGSQNKVKLTLEDGSRYPLDGTLQFRDITVDQTTGSVILRAVFPNPGEQLLPGMFVRAIVTEGVNRHAIMVPQQAVFRDPRGTPMAMVVDADGKAAVRILTLDRAIGSQWLATSGLAAGEQVIVEGLLKARPGSPVRAVPATLGPPPSAGPAASQPTTRSK